MNTAFVGSAYFTRHESAQYPIATAEPGDRVADGSDGTTIITTQGLNPSKVPRSAISEPNGAIYAIGSSGNLLYKNGTYHSYLDVDPVPNTSASVMYVAAEYVPQSRCGTEFPCYITHVEIVNMSTDDVHRVYSSNFSGPAKGNAGRWHDVDRYDDDSILIADIETDSVVIVNVTSGLVEWEWRAANEFTPASGGKYLYDWTHINDVELLDDGRIMADLRNQDAVVFLHPETGLQRNWTLGSEGNYEILKKQHNPDYIPAPMGGPAVVVADSRNHRIVEYQRTNGSWEQAWVWQDSRMDWPRDADRLPSGHTLITDTRSNRVFEIDENGEIVWSVTVDVPYEAERFETGDESEGGESATRLGLESRTADDEQSNEITIKSILKRIIPDQVIGAIVFVKPGWMSFLHIGSVFAILGTLLIWPPLEYYWSGYRLTLRNPLRLERG